MHGYFSFERFLFFRTTAMRCSNIRFGLAALITCACYGQGLISTVAGSDWKFPSTPIKAVDAPLGAVHGVAADLNGNVYIVDPDNNMVMRIARDGTLTSVAGTGVSGIAGDGGPAQKAQLQYANGIALDLKGNLYIADGGNRVRKVDANGFISTL